MKNLKITLSTFLIAGTLMCGNKSYAQVAGDIDVNWATDGWLMDDHVVNQGEIYSSLRKLSDDRFMMVGRSNDANMNMILACYHADGTLDTSFGNQGVAIIDASIGANDGAFDIVELWDGKILVAGSTTGLESIELVVLRLEANGDMDYSFGNSGQVRYSGGVGSWCIPSKIVVSSSNNIFIGASINQGSTWDFVTFKLTQGGGFDANYGANGVSIILDNVSNEHLKSMHITPSEEVIFAGNLDYGANQSAILVKLTANGALDPAFGTMGFYKYENSTFNFFNDLLVDAQGHIIVVGHEGSGVNVDGIIMKFIPDGSLDLPFGFNGLLTMDIGVENGVYYNNIAQKADGNYIATGRAYGLSLQKIHAFTFDATGEADCEFACEGVYHDFDIEVTEMQQTLLAIMDDGSILTGGYLTSPDFVGENMFVTKLLIANQIVGLDNLTANDINIVVYPNPAAEYFQISGLENIDVVGVQLIDINGRIIQSWNEATTVYQLDNLAKGNYFLQVITKNEAISQMLAIK